MVLSKKRKKKKRKKWVRELFRKQGQKGALNNLKPILKLNFNKYLN